MSQRSLLLGMSDSRPANVPESKIGCTRTRTNRQEQIIAVESENTRCTEGGRAMLNEARGYLRAIHLYLQTEKKFLVMHV